MEENLSKYPFEIIASISTCTDKLLGTAFLLSSNLLITCYHVLKDGTQDLNDDFIIQWHPLNFKTRAKIIAIDNFTDTAILNCQEWPTNVIIPEIKTNFNYNLIPFFSFGFRKSNIFKGLHANGTILGITSRMIKQTEVRLIQLKSGNIDFGMSGAPVFVNYNENIYLLGMITSFWETNRSVDSDLAFAMPIDDILKFINRDQLPLKQKIVKINKRIDRDYRISLLLKYCAVFLILEKFQDGAYAKSLWKCGGKDFTEDVGNPDLIRKLKTKKAISVTSWAAQALFKAFGFGLRNSIEQSINYILSHYHQESGTFGYVYNINPSNPYAQPENEFVPNPRHTASAIKLLIQLGIYNRVVSNGLLFLLKTQKKNGLWGEIPGHKGNTLATVYVLDCMSLLQNDLRIIQSTFAPEEYEYFIKHFHPALEKGFSALANIANDDGSWCYRQMDHNPQMRIYYTAHVWAFLPQLFIKFPELSLLSLKYLTNQQNKDGGFPAVENGKSEVGPTSMLLYGIAKSNLSICDDLKNNAITFLTSLVSEDKKELLPLNVFDSTFTLLLSQIPEISMIGWQDETLTLINQLNENILSLNESKRYQTEVINLTLKLLNTDNFDLTDAVNYICDNV